VDWPWASVGSPWFDASHVVLNVCYPRGGSQADALLAHPVFAGAPDGLVACYIAGLAGYFTHQAALPAVPGIPTLRAFQRDQGAALLGWLRRYL